MKALMKRDDQPAIRDTVIWLGLMVVFASGAYLTWPTLWSIPFFLAYGVLYGSATDARWHECGHGTAFKTQWMNDVVYQIASFMIMRNPVRWRWSHTRHHTDTLIVGLDPEIAVMRPPVLLRVMLAYVGVLDAWDAMKAMVVNAAGYVSAEERTFIPETEVPKVIFVARIWFLIYAATIALAIYMGSILPLMFVGAPRLYGAWHHVLTGLTQHGALADNVLDHRMNSRTVYMNPVSRFIYLNMNYHVEHHMFPMVPYHALPKLHEMIKADLPPATPSIWACYKEMIPVWLRQLRGEDIFLIRELPKTAKPYRPDLHDQTPARAAVVA
jgi:fatty acid desaturase